MNGRNELLPTDKTDNSATDPRDKTGKELRQKLSRFANRIRNQSSRVLIELKELIELTGAIVPNVRTEENAENVQTEDALIVNVLRGIIATEETEENATSTVTDLRGIIATEAIETVNVLHVATGAGKFVQNAQKADQNAATVPNAKTVTVAAKTVAKLKIVAAIAEIKMPLTLPRVSRKINFNSNKLVVQCARRKNRVHSLHQFTKSKSHVRRT